MSAIVAAHLQPSNLLAQARTVHPADAVPAMNKPQFASVGCTVSGRSAFVQMQNDFHAVQLQIELEIQQLIQDSRIKNSPLSLFKDTIRSQFPYPKLRWRQRAPNATYKNMTWLACQAALDRMAPTLKRHYQTTNRRASELNTLSKMVSHNLTCLDAHLTQLTQLSASAGCKSTT